MYVWLLYKMNLMCHQMEILVQNCGHTCYSYVEHAVGLRLMDCLEHFLNQQ